ncbi:PAS domain-containing hybrid sensor histidine kinase/response regulator [Pelobacter seleniigenes]|uniref:PAS domain-containing hybrid sensor histidine kinase/response regulator n=1 Tax=Pelobacter seleniigenes TaxID=407188 RepID=UPI00068BC6A4|nr:PAS domain S-box protein [Pelobacter seleniigenes]
MAENQDISLDQYRNLEERLAKLAQKKSRIELINSLLSRLSTVQGLDNMIEHILNALMQTIGANNIFIVYQMNDAWRYRDIYQQSHPYYKGENPNLDLALATGQPQRTKISEAPSREHCQQPDETVENWIFPLQAQNRKVGAVCFEGMQLTDKNIFDELLPFFVYAGLMLDNELSNYSKLEEAHRRLQDSETLYRNLFDQSPDGIVLWSLPDLKPVQFNTAAHTLLGYSREEFAALSVPDIHQSRAPEEITKITAQVKTQKTVHFEAKQHTKTGELRSSLVSLKLLEISGKQTILAMHRDVTEYKKTQESMALLNFAMDHISEAVYLIAADGTFRFVNNEAVRALGYRREELLTMSVAQIAPDLPAEAWPVHWQEMKESGTLTIQGRHLRKNGEIFPVEITANHFIYDQVEYNLALVTDITDRLRSEEERRQFEKQMVQTQKMESLGVLAGGVAHDFNNLLAAIMGHSELTKRRLPNGSPAIEHLKQIEHAAERAADLAKQMLAYSGRGKFVVERIDLNSLLKEMLHMLQVSISKKVVLRLNPYPTLPALNADATQLRQIIMNLVINASEAIGERSGVISITTGCMDCDESYLKNIWLNENLTGGLYVYLEIADTGCGMDKETLAKIFDPFFSTKFTGRGLGMSAVMGIVRGHNGAIKVYSELGQGTTFKILLPASEKPAELFANEAPEENWTGTGKVLLVDDEETVRGIGVEMLKELGFSTITARDGKEALEIYRNTPDIILVILDLTMPRMDGEQCFRELKTINPQVKAVISSGYNEQEVSQKFIGKGISGFVQKPYKLAVLRGIIKKLLQQ